jgi:hypothetical protein
MVFTVLRSFEGNMPPDELICSDEDFGNAIWLSKIYLKHSLFMYEALSATSEDDKIQSSLPITKFLDSLQRGKVLSKERININRKGDRKPRTHRR